MKKCCCNGFKMSLDYFRSENKVDLKYIWYGILKFLLLFIC